MLPREYMILIQVEHLIHTTSNKSNMIFNNQEIEKIMHDILPTSKPQQIGSSQVRVKISLGNFQQLRMLMDNVVYFAPVLQSLKHKMQPGNSWTSRHISRHNHNVHSKHDSKGTIDSIQI